MRVTRRLWSQGGYLYIEPADGCGDGFWVDHLGRIGAEQDDGSITWVQIEDQGQGNQLSIVGNSPALDGAQLAIEELRLYGVTGQGRRS